MTKARNIAELANDISVDNNRDVTLSNLRSDQPMTFRNKIINGNFDIWQRGTSQTSGGYGSADRWMMFNSGSSKTASQQAFTVGQTEVPGNPKYYLRHVITTGGTSNDYVKIRQKIEGASTLAGETATLSFWAKADANKNIATEFLTNYGTGGNPSEGLQGVGVTTHSLTTSWQKFTTTISIPSISGKTLGTDGNDWMSFDFWLDAGSTHNSRTNSLGNQSGTFDIAQVQVEEGSVPTPFEHRPYGVELALCQRYYEVIETNNNLPLYLDSSNSNNRHIRIFFKTTKRGLPTTVAATSGSILNSLGTSVDSHSYYIDVGNSTSGANITSRITITSEL